MKARFIGDPANDFDGPAVMKLGSTEFEKGKWTTVPKALEGKVEGHSHFETQAEKVPGSEKDKKEPSAPEPAVPATEPTTV